MQTLYGVSYDKEKYQLSSKLLLMKNKICAVSVFFSDYPVKPFIIHYSFNDEQIFNSMMNDLEKMGYQKVEEKAEIGKIITVFENKESESFVFNESFYPENPFKYDFSFIYMNFDDLMMMMELNEKSR